MFNSVAKDNTGNKNNFVPARNLTQSQKILGILSVTMREKQDSHVSWQRPQLSEKFTISST